MGRLLIQFPGTNTTKALSETLPKNTIIVDEDLHQLRLHDGTTVGGHIIGGGSIDAIDGATITKNSDDEIQAVATVNQNTASGATNPVFDWVGTLAEYQAQNIETLHPDWLCYITDDNVAQAFDAYSKIESNARYVQQGYQVIESQAPTAGNSYTWYRKYADGWVEQGGTTDGTSNPTAITLPVEMMDTNYGITLGANSYSSSNYDPCIANIRRGTVTTTGFSIQTKNHQGDAYNNVVHWEVKGMVA